MGPVLFVGLSALALVSQGQGEVEFANPAVTMKEFSFAEPPPDVTHTVLYAAPVAVSGIAPGPARDPATEVILARGADDSFAAPAPSAIPPVQASAPETRQSTQITDAPSLDTTAIPAGRISQSGPAIIPGQLPDETPGALDAVAEPSLDPAGPTHRFAAQETWIAPGAPGAFSRIPRPGVGPGPHSAHPDEMTVIADPTARPAIVDGDFVNLRTRPDSNGDTIAQFNRGEAALVTQTVGNWARVMIGGETGWMYLRYLQVE
ncbi:SH3 domain-containing protein [Primorskyibacter aestuariivivens]|uniref:SH3 domain-containing protein n=1 Tax=Primorskyibacter aestuariivivens TaxID=1888912 RepID=UPI002301E87A|nr:SH3 domain-containing protein [Primorskyibacter aestuariivivens]MDA7429435.1 SH3 domain-containing protein [Primorskyibacter aestuariivivens]